MKKWEVWATCPFGTFVAGFFKAKTGSGAISKARAKHGKEYTYYLPSYSKKVSIH